MCIYEHLHISNADPGSNKSKKFLEVFNKTESCFETNLQCITSMAISFLPIFTRS